MKMKIARLYLITYFDKEYLFSLTRTRETIAYYDVHRKFEDDPNKDVYLLTEFPVKNIKNRKQITSQLSQYLDIPVYAKKRSQMLYR